MKVPAFKTFNPVQIFKTIKNSRSRK